MPISFYNAVGQNFIGGHLKWKLKKNKNPFIKDWDKKNTINHHLESSITKMKFSYRLQNIIKKITFGHVKY